MKYNIKSNLRVLAFEKGIKTKVAICNITGLSRPTIDKIESGNIGSIKFEILLKVCEALNCTIEELITMVPEEEN